MKINNTVTITKVVVTCCKSNNVVQFIYRVWAGPSHVSGVAKVDPALVGALVAAIL